MYNIPANIISKKERVKYGRTITINRNKIKAFDFLGNKCKICGNTEKLQFDHIIPSTKKYNIASRYDRSWEKLLLELKKCQLLCVACHREKTREDRKKYPNLYHSARLVHGSPSGYSNHNCRCIPCTHSWSNYIKERRYAARKSIK